MFLQKKHIFFSLSLAFLLGVVPVRAAVPIFTDIIARFVSYIEALTALLFALVFISFLWTGVNAVRYSGTDKRKDHFTKLFWGVFVLFVLFSVWGIIRLLTGSVLGI